MKAGFSLLGLLLFAVNGYAEDGPGVDYCRNAKVEQEWQKHLSDYPNDPIILKLAGLREGLCLMIDRKQISHEATTEIWEQERQQSIVDRAKEDSSRMTEFVL